MEDENEYKKLPTEEKCVHKLWKARVAGYEEAIKLFNQIDDEKAPEWNKFLGLIKKFVTDSNAVAQEKGLEAALVFVENCGHAGKTTGEVMSGIVAKCIAAPKTKTKDLALQVTLMYIEIEKHEIVEEELLKGMEQKNPKVVAACISALNTALKQFGNKVIAIKPMVKKIPILLADRDKGVRDEMKALVIEMHRWIGAAIEPHIASLQAVVQQELRESFSSGGASPTRYLRSQQHRVRDTPAADSTDGGADDEDAETGGGDSADVDAYDLLDPVEILSKLPKDFYDKLEAKKWQERKEALDSLDNLLKNAPKLEPGDYADLVRALKKVITKDTNVMLVALGGRLLGALASGLRARFAPYACACVQAALEKFKERKPAVVAALREAVDAIYPCTNLEAIMEDMLAAFENKNPSIKAESALFLARALCHTQPAAFNKKLIKAYVAGLLKLLESADPVVRDAAAEALGTATKLVGEKNIAPHIGKLDNLKEQKIKEFAEKAEIKVKVAAPKKDNKPKAAPPATGKGDAKPTAGSAQPKPVKRPASAKKPAGVTKKAPARGQPSPPREQEMSPEEVDAKAEQLFPPDVLNGLADTNWKTRLAAVQGFQAALPGAEAAGAQLLYRVLGRKPGLRDTNVQVLRARLEACKYITDNYPVSTTAADFVLQDIVTKLGETSCSAICADCLTSLAESCGLEHVLNESLAFAMDSQKNPKVQAELFNWMTIAIKEFGFTMNVKSIVVHSKKALLATNPNVRTSTINFLGVLSLYVGPSLINHFDSEKAATKQLISLEIDKYANSTPPTPTRQMGTVSKSASKGSMGDDIEEAYDEGAEDEPAAPDDNRPRTDIAPLITDALIAEINDKNWKVRNEGLDKVKAIITNSSPIKPTLGELPAALGARLLDSNSKLAQSALQICELLAAAMGSKCKQHVRTFFPAFFQAFGDSKAWIRAAAVSCVEAWCRAAGAHAALDGEMVLDALRAGSPVLRAALLAWLADKLPSVCSVSRVEAWCRAAGAHAALDGEMVLDALRAGSPVLRAALLAWLADKLPSVCSVSRVEAWCRAAGAHAALDGEMVLDALRAGSPVLRAALLAWLADKLPSVYSVSRVEAWCRAAGAHAALDGEMVLDALRAGSPVLRAALLAWLADKLPSVCSVSRVEAWCRAAGAHAALDGEMVLDALRAGSPVLRAALLAWLADKLPSVCSVSRVEAWCRAAGAHAALDGEMVLDALRAGSPVLRAALLAWLADKLPSVCSVSRVEAWCRAAGAHAALDGEMVLDALRAGSPVLRAALLAWLADKLPSVCSVSRVEAWCRAAGAHAALDGEMVLDALRAGSPVLRAALLAWLADKLPSVCSVSRVEAWCRAAGAHAALDGEMVLDALRAGSPVLRAALLAWLADKLPSVCSVSRVEAWCRAAGAHAALDGEMVLDALRAGSPVLRAALLAWLADKLPSVCSVSRVEAWCRAAGAHAALDGEMVLDALRAGSPVLRAALLAWLADKLPSVCSVSRVEAWCRAAGAHAALDGEMVLDALRAGSPVLRAALLAWLADKLPSGTCLAVCSVSRVKAWCRAAGAHAALDGEMVLDALRAGSPVLRAALLAWLADKLPSVCSVSRVEAWCRAAGAHAALDGEMVLDALRAGSPVLRAALLAWLADKLPSVYSVSRVEAWCRAAGAHAALDGEMVLDALRAGSPVLRAALLAWLADKLPSVPAKSFPREELAGCVPLLFACLEDRAADVRKAAADCVLPFMLHLGYEHMHKQLDKLKPGSKSVVQAALDKARPNLPVQPLPAKTKKEEPKTVKSAGAMKKEAEKKTGQSAKSKVVKPTSASNRGKKEDEDCTPLLPNNNAKNQRIIDDQKLKVLKWNFTTPREEFFELLKEQMNSAGLNKQLVANMFHSDFRYHLKAIEALSEDLHENGSALVCNLDLVLKWLTLRFFDTNPSVILKGLEYLTMVFQYLIDYDYTMAEYEANCFIPYLVLKVGDPKDTVRNGVKALFRQICVVYSVTKLFGYLMEGLKSKNARQRTECLECINHLLETYGSSVVAGGGTLRELARHIGDRDNGVRSAALNCVATAYFLDGERVYKMIGQISDKDLSLLEERIKRASKSRSAEERRSMVVPLSADGRPIQQVPEQDDHVMAEDQPPPAEYEEEEIEETPPPPQPVAPEPKVITGPFGLDPDLIAKLDAAVPVLRKPDLPELDLKFLDEPVPASTVRNVTAPIRPSMATLSPPRHVSPHAPAPAKPAVDDSQLADTIHSISSPDLNAAIRALSLISGALVSGRGAALGAHEARLVAAVAAQLRRLRTAPAPAQHTLPAYKYLAGALTTFYETAGCGRQVGESALRSLLGELLLVLGAAPTTPPPAADAERLVRILNNVCVRVLEHSPRTALLCAIVSLLHDSIVESDPAYPRYQDLLLKCFWKTLKMISTWDVNSIDYDAVLYKIHLFYKAYPNSYWKKNPEISDTPYRTVKTLVHTLVKMKGASITNHLTQIPDVNESDLYPYLHKVLKQLKLDERKDNPADMNGGLPVGGVGVGGGIGAVGANAALSAGRLPRAVHEELALILKRIGSKEHNRDALAQLYDLRERHPEVDIWTFMQGSSFYFRNYVERGLREVAEQRKMASMPMYKSDYKADNIDISNENDEKSHVIFLERLRALQAKAGLKTESNPSSQPRTPVSDNRALADSISEALPRAHSIDPQLELHTTQAVSQKNEAAVDALRLKLQQIKSSSKR
ncbi:unnamed protein product [Euphydryas editha]|uniref:TOG domain-containing protein n=1 Tax=Euphydryas editha TaxID=104508 RepID=A0AAU9TPW2_EUPED|nr:unnamed protein product [Euphydryas editha]